MTKLVVLLFLFACACSSANTFPPQLGDCDSCTTPPVVSGGHEAGADATLKDGTTQDVSTLDVTTSDADDDASDADDADDTGVDTDAGD